MDGKMFLPVKPIVPSSAVTTNGKMNGTNGVTADDIVVTCNSTQTPCDLSPMSINDEHQPQQHHQHSGHCIASFAAIDQMRKNAEIYSKRPAPLCLSLSLSRLFVVRRPQGNECRTISVNFRPTVVGKAIGKVTFKPTKVWPDETERSIHLYGYGGHTTLQLQGIERGPIGVSFLKMAETSNIRSTTLQRVFFIYNKGPLNGMATISVKPKTNQYIHETHIQIEPKKCVIRPDTSVKVNVTHKLRRKDLEKLTHKSCDVLTVATLEVIMGADPNRQRIATILTRWSTIPAPYHSINSDQWMVRQCRRRIQLCDVILDVDGETINAHRVILASVSPYFYAMFNDDMIERNQNTVKLHDVSPLALRQLIDYAYSGEITITEDNVQVLLPASSLLQIQSVREACCKFLLRQLHPSNCLGIRSFADAHSCKELHTRSHKYALQNFQQVVGTEEFLLLPFSEVNDLISNNQLNICSEEKVFTAVLSWLKNDLFGRKQHVYELMSHVRLPLVNREFLMSCVECEPLIREDQQCKELLLEAMKYHLLPEQRSTMTTHRTSERRPAGMRPYVFAVGGGSLFAIHNECECYNPRNNSWTQIAPMLCKRSRAGVTALRKMLFVIGGYDGINDLSTAESYNPLTNMWQYITPMGTKRSCLGVCAFDGLIYIGGGYDGASCLSSVERYDTLTGVWSSCGPMSVRRRYCRLAVLDHCIYALGGYDSTAYHASVERFDPRVGRWSAVPCMSTKRSSVGVATLNGELYCVGGNDGTIAMQSGERFNARRNSWEPIASMETRRSTHELIDIEGYLYALGGNDGASSLSSVEKYDPSGDEWCCVQPLSLRRTSVGAAVVECFNLERGLVQTTNL